MWTLLGLLLSCGAEHPSGNILGVQPATVRVGDLPAEVTIRGTGFLDGVQLSVDDDERPMLRGRSASIGGAPVLALRAVDASTLVGIAPRLPEGIYSVEVTLGRGRRLELRQAFTVVGGEGVLPTNPEPSNSEPPSPESTGSVTTDDTNSSATQPLPRACESGTFGTPSLVWANEASSDRGPSLSADRLVLSFSRETGEGVEELMQASRIDVDSPFGPPRVLDELSTDRSTTPILSRDGLRIYFASNRSGNWDLWAADRQDASFRFGNLHPLVTLNTAADERAPWLSPDEAELYFERDRNGQLDIWRARRTAPGEYISAELVSQLDTSALEGSPSLTPSGHTCFFLSDEGQVPGVRRLHRATRVSFTSDFLLRTEVAELDAFDMSGFASLSPDGRELVFGTHDGTRGRLWRVARECDD